MCRFVQESARVLVAWAAARVGRRPGCSAAARVLGGSQGATPRVRGGLGGQPGADLSAIERRPRAPGLPAKVRPDASGASAAKVRPDASGASPQRRQGASDASPE